MGRAIVASLMMVSVVAILTFLILRAQKVSKQVGDLNRKQEQDLRRMVGDAAEVMRGLGQVHGDSLHDFDVLSDRSRESIDQWLRDHAVFVNKNKEINA